ncbi:MAG TPA: hypothetical protein VK753_06080 [Xanthomonadaceae bacterium]|jgi:hypothetical protein|nr:hypothetical protein [Xanthomonadaceae bacterium]
MANNDEAVTGRRSKLPWPTLGFLGGLLGYAAIRFGIAWYASSYGGPSLAGLARQASSGALDPYAWAVLGICWLGAAVSWLGRRRSRPSPPQVSIAEAPVPSPAASPQPQPAAPESNPIDTDAPVCPRCGAAMYKRFNQQTSLMYWGCVMYPACKGSQPL